MATTVNKWDASALELMDSGRYKTKECTRKKNEMSNVEKSDIEGDGDPFSMPYLNYNYSGKVATCKSEEGQL